jgi:xanthine dehydrogenase accessory factor
MDETFSQLEEFGRTERLVAMATLVATKGTTPKKEGAKMWVGEGRRVLGSVTIGGCVDARVIAESEAVLEERTPRLLRMAMGDEDAWELGLSCGGTVEVLVEAVPLSADAKEAPLLALYRRIAAEVDQGHAACLVRPLEDPARALLVLHDGAFVGTLGSAAIDDAARAEALELIGRGTSRARPLGEAFAGAGGQEAFFEVHAPRRELVVVGAGQISMSLVTLARALGFRTTVVDARPRFANRERFPDADELRVGVASEIVSGLRLNATGAVVLTVHDYKVEVPVLRAVLASPVGYVGMLGNRRRGAAVVEMLREKGVSEEDLARLHVPVGLEIGAQSGAEIGLSVLAQIVALRAGRAAPDLAGLPARSSYRIPIPSPAPGRGEPDPR